MGGKETGRKAFAQFDMTHDSVYIEVPIRHVAKWETVMNVAISKLDAVSLRNLMRLDLDRIVAEDATPEAIEACRLMGVELLLSSDPGSRTRCWVSMPITWAMDRPA